MFRLVREEDIYVNNKINNKKFIEKYYIIPSKFYKNKIIIKFKMKWWLDELLLIYYINKILAKILFDTKIIFKLTQIKKIYININMFYTTKSYFEVKILIILILLLLKSIIFVII